MSSDNIQYLIEDYHDSILETPSGRKRRAQKVESKRLKSKKYKIDDKIPSQCCIHDGSSSFCKASLLSGEDIKGEFHSRKL